MRDQVALVTGGSRGIGRAIALELARSGAHVAVHYHTRRDAAEAVVAEVRALGRQAVALEGDLGASELGEDWLQAVEDELGPVRLLALSAGTSIAGMAAYMPIDEFDRVLAVNLRGSVLAAQAVLPGMLRARQGAIVVVASEAGLFGSPGLAAYAASKGAQVAWAKSLAAEVGSRGVRVNVISPGPIETDMLAELPDEAREQVVSRIALGRFGQPEEVATVARFLLSEDARYVTGAVVPVNGGLRML